MTLRVIACAWIAVLIGCAERQRMDCPDGLSVDTSRMDHAVRAKYSAEQVKDEVRTLAASFPLYPAPQHAAR